MQLGGQLLVLLVLVVGAGTVGGMKTETPRDGAGAKLCGWCGGAIRQSGVGRSKDYCSRTHKEYAYRARRDERLIAVALAAAAPVSTTAETPEPVSPVVETRSPQVAPRIPAPVVDEDFHLAPPDPAPVLPDAWRAPAPAPAPRRPLSRRRADMTASAIPLPLPFDGLEDDEGI